MGKLKCLVLGLVFALFAVSWGVEQAGAQLTTPDYFGVPNWANSPFPQIDASGAVIPGTGMRKFVDTLPGLCALGVNNLGQCLPLATKDTGNYPLFQGPPADFYRIGSQEYTVKMHSDLPPTSLRGYIQIDSGGNPVYDPATPTQQQYLGPLILATRNRPVRALFNNRISTNLNIPVDTTYMGAGMVNDGVNSMMASQKRGTLHLHGGNTPWISDGTTMQWITPAGGDGQPNALGFAKGFSFQNVPDMPAALGFIPDPFDGLQTFYWTNQQSGRLMFFHDHAYGITRLNVYVGEAAGLLLVDPAQESALAAATVPGTIVTDPLTGTIVTADLAHIIPLVIQDKTYVPDAAQLAATDPTWSTPLYGSKGNLWFPHVYMPNQNPFDMTGANPFGRWDWGPWFWPPQPVAFPAVPCTSIAYPGVQLTCPSTPNPSGTPEAFMDTPAVNGTAYPKLVVDPRAYRFQILSIGNDRALNLGLYVADPLSISVTKGGSGYTTSPTVTLTGGGGTYTSTAATVAGGAVTGIAVNGATSYTSAPTVTITGGGGTGAAAIASVNTEVKMVPAVPADARSLMSSGSGTVASLTLTSGGSGYTSAPTVTITGGGGSGATATATLGGKPVASITVTSFGSGYTSTPTVTISGGGGSGATATATVFFGFVFSITVTNGGGGYTSVPTVTISGGGGSGATASATLAATGNSVAALTLTNGGSGYTSPPTVTISGGGGSGAASAATLALLPGGLPDCTTSNQMSGGGLVLAQDTLGNPINTPTGLPTGCWPTYDSTFFGPLSWPTDSREGGVPDPTTAGPAIIQIGTEGGLLPNVAVIPSTPISYDYNKRSVTVLNVLNHGLFLGPAERADIIVDFSAFAGKTLILYNDAPAPVPAADPRVDYYTNDPDNTAMGGAPPTLAGYGPNTRTIMQIVVNNTTPNTSFNLASLRAALPAIFASTQDPIIVPETAYPAANGGAATDTYVRIQDTSISLFSGGPVGGLTLVNGGSGFTSAPTVTISGGGGAGATATATLSATGSVVGLTLTAGGTGYTSLPTVAFSGGGGTGAAATAILTGQPVASIAVTNGGSGYTSAPTVTITGGGGAGATAVAIFPANSPVASLTLTNGGSGFTSAPTVTISGGGGSGATATATLGGRPVASIAVNTFGSGYTSAPTVTISGGGGAGATATATVFFGFVFSISVTNGGSGYTSVPTVTISGGGGAGATATATLSASAPVASITLTNGGSGYTSPPTVAFTGGGGSGATATASIGRAITGITLTNGGSGFLSPPIVTITGGGGSGAAATAILPGPSGVAGISVTNGGSGYTSAPTVTISGGGGAGATATATLAANGPVASLTLTNGGTGFTSAPTVTISGGSGSGATATATLGGRPVASIAVNTFGSGYTSAPTVTISGGGGAGATATATVFFGFVFSISVTNGGSGYTSVPTVTISGGGGAGATATATLSSSAPVVSLTLTNGGSGYTSPPTVAFTGGGGSGATATATIGGPVASITLTNVGTGYTSPPTVTITGGGGSGATATATLPPPMGIASLTLTNGGTGYTSAPTVTISGGGGSGATATAAIGMSVASITLTAGGTGYTSPPTVAFTGGGGSGALALATGTVTPLLPKAIQELFTLDYGRMNALLGVELPFTTNLIQTTIPYGYIDPPTEVFKDGDTQLWKITHNGVDTHFIHFHLFTVQVINRVGWDGAIKPPDPNEMSFKDTVRMNPLEDIVVALKAMKPNLPWPLPNSIRPLDVTMPLGTTAQFLGVDPTNEPAVVTNSLVNFGWEYVWHCHILGHEENDMMRAMGMSVAPNAPLSLVATPLAGPPRVQLDWVDNSINETDFTIRRSSNGGVTWANVATVTSTTGPGTGSPVTYTDTTVVSGTTYDYQVIANNVVGYRQTYAPPAIGYPQISADSVPSNSVSVTP